MRGEYAKSTGIRRRGGGGEPLLPAVTEEIDVSDFNGNATIDITTIGGIAVENFTHIQISCVDLVRSSTGSHLEMELRQQGGAFIDENYRWQGTSSTNRNPNTADFELTDATNSNTHNCIIWLSSVNQPCPTIIDHANLNSAASFPAFHRGMTIGAVVHDAIRFIANGGGGSETWTSGSIVIAGYRCKVGTLYTVNFSSTTEEFIDFAPGEYIADVAFSNIALSTPLSIGLTVGTGDSYVTSDYKYHILDSIDSSTGISTFGFSVIVSGGATTGGYACGHLYNMQTAAPVCFQGQILQGDGTDTAPQEIRSYIQQSITPYDQIRIGVNTGNITSGTLYIQTYKPRRTILLAEDLTSYGSSNVQKAGLKKNNASLLVLATVGATSASAAGTGYAQVGTSGGYTGAANTYRYLQLDEGFDDAGSTSVFSLTDFISGGRTGRDTLSVFAGLPQDTRTMQIYAADLTNGLSGDVMGRAGVRTAAAVEDRIQMVVPGGIEFNAGAAYLVGYSM